jgi:hypothetical protein
LPFRAGYAERADGSGGLNRFQEAAEDAKTDGLLEKPRVPEQFCRQRRALADSSFGGTRGPNSGYSWWDSAGCPVVQFSPDAEPGRLPLRHRKIQNDASGCVNACQ